MSIETWREGVGSARGGRHFTWFARSTLADCDDLCQKIRGIRSLTCVVSSATGAEITNSLTTVPGEALWGSVWTAESQYGPQPEAHGHAKTYGSKQDDSASPSDGVSEVGGTLDGG